MDRVLERRVVGPRQGPGEVGIVQRLQLLAADTLAYVDPNQRRATFFTPESRFVTQLAFPRFNDGTDVGLIARLDHGRWLGTMRPPFVPIMSTGDRVYRTPFAVVAFAVDTIALVPDVEAYAMTTTEEGETRPDEYPLRFGRSTVIASDGRRTFVGTNEQHEIVEYGPRGAVRRIWNGTPALPVADGDRTRLLDWVLRETDRSGRSSSARDVVRQIISQWRFATTFACFDKLRVGTDGTLWEEAPWVLTSDARRYVVYDTAGRAIARAEFPTRVTPLRVSATAMLGSRLDGDDAPQLQQWRVRPTRCGLAVSAEARRSPPDLASTANSGHHPPCHSRTKTSPPGSWSSWTRPYCAPTAAVRRTPC